MNKKFLLLRILKTISTNKLYAVLAIIFLTLFSVNFSAFLGQILKGDFKISKQSEHVANRKDKSEKNVLSYSTPQIYISGGNENYNSGGMIALASTDEPVVNISAYNVSGKIEVAVYEADEQAVLDYLTHDKDGKQLKLKQDLQRFRFIKTIEHKLTANSEPSKLLLPLGDSGIYYLKLKYGSFTEESFVLRSNIGIVVKEGDDEYIFWGQDYRTKKSMHEGSLSLYNLEEDLTEVGSALFDQNGIAKTRLTADADIALVRNAGEKAIVPINLRYLNSGYNYKPFVPKFRITKYFLFTDRPLYRPGDTIYFKAVLRDDDDARYTIPKEQALVRMYSSYGDENLVFEKNYPISIDGTLDGEFRLPENAKTGYYSMAVVISGSNQGNSWFKVDFFRKPEYSLDLNSDLTELVAGDNLTFSINGSYFSGQPLAGQKVKYKIYSGDYYEYGYNTEQLSDLNDDYRYGYWGGEKLTSGEAVLGKDGKTDVKFETQLSADTKKSRVYSIEAEFDDGSGNPAFSRKNILVYAGEYDIYRQQSVGYTTKINKRYDLPIILKSHKKTSVSGVDLAASIIRETWVKYQEEDKKYPSYRKEEERLPALKAKTDDKGNTVFSFTPVKAGYYKINISGKDKRGNSLSKVFYTYVTSNEYVYYDGEGGDELTVKADKLKYLPGQTARLTLSSSIPNRDIFLSLERGRLQRYQVIKMDGYTADVDILLVDTDMPNIFAKASSFSSNSYDTGSEKLTVSPESKKLQLKVTTDSKKYGPGENVRLDINTSDIDGNPQSADLAVWAVDKALFELVDEKPEQIFDTFWSERYNDTEEAHSLEGIIVLGGAEMGGCFASGTQVLMADNTKLAIEKVKAGDSILTYENENSKNLVKAKVLSTHKSVVPGYIIINEKLRVTDNHKLWVNDSWKEAGSVQIGDRMIDDNGKPVMINSIEWLKGKYSVYNLNIEKYHTFFADGVYVHNEKGDPRTVFKDTAYWNPSVHTDSSGKAQISFKLPDNLTTWVIAGIGSTVDTKVGQTTSEITVTKDVIVRPVLPNILREGDKVVLSALIQNFTEDNHRFDTELKFDSGEVLDSTQSGINLKAKETQQVFWTVLPTKYNPKAKLTFSLVSQKDKKIADVVVQEVPVRAFGFSEQRAQTGDGVKTYELKLSVDSHKEESSVSLSLAPTILGTLPSAMKYLVDYPYGCVEQTTSRFVPAVIAKAHPDLFTDALKGKDIDAMVEKGLSRLSSLQLSDGGWTWWYSGQADPFITAYVVEYILLAKESGIKIDEEMLKLARRYLVQNTYYDNRSRTEKTYANSALVAKTYALTLLGINDKVGKLTDLDNLTPDYVALAVMANYLNGDKNPQSNGLAKLMGMAITQGDAVFWAAGAKENFASNDASTALAIRAIVLANGERELAVKGVRYLTRNRQSQYWSNTFATAQVIRSIVELTQTGDELNPDYSYSVMLDNQKIGSGRISSAKQKPVDIEIPVSKVKPAGSKIVISKTGEGQLYSTLLIDEFHTDRKAKADSHGLSVKREYVNDKGEQYSLALGDTVTVRITVSGLKSPEQYGVIADELPAGLIPVNRTFNNQQFSNDPYGYYYSSFDVTDREVTENGMVLSLYQINSGERTYTYKARVVNTGRFTVPPAFASLMYAPEIYGRSEVSTIEISKESKVIPRKWTVNAKKPINEKSNLRYLVLASVIVVIFLIIRLRTTFLNVLLEKTIKKIKLLLLKKSKNTQV